MSKAMIYLAVLIVVLIAAQLGIGHGFVDGH
jgi:hypothetical protein